MNCTLYTLNLNNKVAYGKVFLSNQQGQTIHGVPLQDDCCRVSIDQVVKGGAFLPYEAGDMRTVEDALGSFVAWPKNLIKNSDQQVSYFTFHFGCVHL
jgi:TNP1/EN/SPM transposase